jgi:hypothetical protein
LAKSRLAISNPVWRLTNTSKSVMPRFIFLKRGCCFWVIFWMTSVWSFWLSLILLEDVSVRALPPHCPSFGPSHQPKHLGSGRKRSLF